MNCVAAWSPIWESGGCKGALSKASISLPRAQSTLQRADYRQSSMLRDAARLAALSPLCTFAWHCVYRAKAEAGLRLTARERLHRIEAAALRALGEDGGWNWIRRRHRTLPRAPRPFVLDSEEGDKQVEQLLGRFKTWHSHLTTTEIHGATRTDLLRSRPANASNTAPLQLPDAAREPLPHRRRRPFCWRSTRSPH